jgi:hypothetical protein
VAYPCRTLLSRSISRKKAVSSQIVSWKATTLANHSIKWSQIPHRNPLKRGECYLSNSLWALKASRMGKSWHCQSKQAPNDSQMIVWKPFNISTRSTGTLKNLTTSKHLLVSKILLIWRWFCHIWSFSAELKFVFEFSMYLTESCFLPVRLRTYQ